MAVKASATITLSFMVDVKATYRYYKLQASTASAPSVPTTATPSGWSDTEPTYTGDETNTLYFVDKTVFTNDSFVYSLVSKSSSYEAAKRAYNYALTANIVANDASLDATNALTKIDKMEIGGINLLTSSDTMISDSETNWVKSTNVTIGPATTGSAEMTIPDVSALRWDSMFACTSIPIKDLYGKNLTFSIEARADENGNTGNNYVYVTMCAAKSDRTARAKYAYTKMYAPDDTVGNQPITTSWTRYTTTFTVTGISWFIQSQSGQDCTDDSCFGVQVFRNNLKGAQYRNFKLEYGNKPTTWSITPQEAADDAKEAAKTATNYMDFQDGTGLVIGNMTDDELGCNTVINSEGMDIRDGETITARFRDKLIELGRNSKESVIKLCQGVGQILVNSVSDTVHRMYISAQSLVLGAGPFVELYADNGVPATDASHKDSFVLAVADSLDSYVSISAVDKNTDKRSMLTVKPNLIEIILGSNSGATTGGLSGNLKDWVVATGTSNTWKYRKWASGTAEAWCTRAYNSTSIQSAYGYQYYCSPSSAVSLPSSIFNAAPQVQATVLSASGLLFISMNSISKTSINFYIASSNPGTYNITAQFYAVGTWK